MASVRLLNTQFVNGIKIEYDGQEYWCGVHDAGDYTIGDAVDVEIWKLKLSNKIAKTQIVEED